MSDLTIIRTFERDWRNDAAKTAIGEELDVLGYPRVARSEGESDNDFRQRVRAAYPHPEGSIDMLGLLDPSDRSNAFRND